VRRRAFIPLCMYILSLFAPSRCGLGRIRRRCHADDYTCETHLLRHPRPGVTCVSQSVSAVTRRARSVAESLASNHPPFLSALIPAARPPLFLACAYMTCLPVSFLPFIQIRTICDTIYQTVTPTEKYIAQPLFKRAARGESSPPPLPASQLLSHAPRKDHPPKAQYHTRLFEEILFPAHREGMREHHVCCRVHLHVSFIPLRVSSAVI
jgi:hypothetical protein